MNKSPQSNNNDREDKRKKILLAALKAYSNYGINKATTRQIAEIADIGKSTIYEYFKSKEDLIDEAFTYLICQMEESKNSIHSIATENPVSALILYIDNTIHIALNDPSTLLLISQYTLNILLKTDKYEEAKAQYQKKMSPLFQNMMNEFTFILNQGIEKGLFKPAINTEIESLVYVIGALIREIQAQAFIKNKEELKETCLKIKETILKLLGIENSRFSE